MKIDLYTKLVLTVIAVMLVWIGIKDSSLIPQTRAQNFQGVYLAPGQLPLPVTIAGVKFDPAPSTGGWQPLRVEIVPFPTPTPTPSPRKTKPVP